MVTIKNETSPSTHVEGDVSSMSL